MDEESNTGVDVVERDATEAAARRERSKIIFPYGDLNDALEVVRPIDARGGNDADESQLSAWMSETTDSGVFRRKLGVARIFGLIRLEKDRVFLTDTGQSIVNPDSEIHAKAQAFLAVPLYRKLYETYKGRPLPNDVNLEQVMESFGVAPKQKSRARRDFQRSAEQAGIFTEKKDRLVLPPGVSLDSPTAPSNGGASRKMEPATHIQAEPNPTQNPALLALFDMLPPIGSEWSVEKREEWMRFAAAIFNRLYRDKE
jgi:hypothetical protein